MKAARNGWWRAGVLAVGIAFAAAPLTAASGSSSDSSVVRRLRPCSASTTPGISPGTTSSSSKTMPAKQAFEAPPRPQRPPAAAIGFTYHSALKGFSAALSPAALTAVRVHGRSQVRRGRRTGTPHEEASQPTVVGPGPGRPAQPSIDQKYKYVGSAGSGVTAYGIDTGIRFTHTDFGGRASSGFDAVDGGSADDCNGHGTHTAGTMGGTKYGVAKKVTLVAVRVLDCGGTGTWGGVIAGIDWVTDNHSGPSVANMSLGGGHMQSVDDAVTASINSGVVYAVSAGNNAPTRAASHRRPHRPRSPSAPRRPTTLGRRTPTTAPASTSSGREATSRRTGAPATPQRTRSAVRRWRLRTLLAWLRST